MTRSYYLGPGRRRVPLRDWDDVVSAAAAGVLDETQWVELKQAVPAPSKDANRELARDLASLSVDGGVLVIGVEDDHRKAGAVVGTPLQGLRTRIDQVARGGITPPLNVAITIVEHPSDNEVGVVVVEVPASVTAPHMVDGSYWGRGATGKAKLTDPAVRHLMETRTARAEGFTRRLHDVRDELEAFPSRTAAHVYLLLEPQVAPSGPPLHERFERPIDALNAVVNARPQRQVYSPNFAGLTDPAPHPDGFLLSSPIDGGQWAQELMIRLLLGDDGSVRLAAARATFEQPTSTGDTTRLVAAEYVIELVHHTLHVASTIAEEQLGFTGQWKVGIIVDRLKGLQASASARWGGGRMLPAYPADEYREVVTASASEMVDSTSEVVRRLLHRFTRGLGVERVLDYTDIGELQRL